MKESCYPLLLQNEENHLRLGRLVGKQSSALFRKLFVSILAVHACMDCFLKHRTFKLLEELGQTPEKDCWSLLNEHS